MDRDGTLNVDTGYVSRPEDVRLIDGAALGARTLAQAGFALVITSNQSGIARGIMTSAQADAVDARVLELLRREDVLVAGLYRCPHLSEGRVREYAVECDCRKPKPGMILQAASELDLDLASSWSVGDSERDVQAGLAAGCRAILLDPEADPKVRRNIQTGADAPGREVAVAKNLLEAAGIIIASP
ncbi:MAG TPA: HAD family hydrolase [Candidatus Acidoferrales bacterium]|nr:HAD family hydrolase [Candidatus Acidoferrales bacterium]